MPEFDKFLEYSTIQLVEPEKHTLFGSGTAEELSQISSRFDHFLQMKSEIYTSTCEKKLSFDIPGNGKHFPRFVIVNSDQINQIFITESASSPKIGGRVFALKPDFDPVRTSHRYLKNSLLRASSSIKEVHIEHISSRSVESSLSFTGVEAK